MLVRLALEAETYRFLERFPGGAHLSRGQLHVHAVSVAATRPTTAELRGAHVDTAHLPGLRHDAAKPGGRRARQGAAATRPRPAATG